MALRLKLKGCQGPDVVRAVSITLVLPVVLEYPTTRVNSYTCRDLAPEGGGGDSWTACCTGRVCSPVIELGLEYVL